MNGTTKGLGLAVGVIASVVVLSSLGCRSMSESKPSRDPSAQLTKAAEEYRRAGFYWEAAEIDPHPPADDQNAAPLLIQAADSIDWTKISKSGIDAQIRDGDIQAARKSLEPVEPGLAKVIEACKRPRLDFHLQWDRGQTVETPFLRESTLILRALCWRALLELKSGDKKDAFRDLEAAGKVGRLLGQVPTTICFLVRIACDTMLLRFIERAAAQVHDDGPSLKKLAAICEMGILKPDFAKILKTEAYLSIASLRNFQPSYWSRMDKDPDARPKLVDPTNLNRNGFPRDNLSRQYMAKTLEYYSLLGPDLKRFDRQPELLGPAEQAASKRLWPDHKESDEIYSNFISSLANKANLGTRQEALSNSLLALIGALEIHVETGSYPSTIEKIPGALPDPFDKKPLHLKLTPDGLRVYSVGPDLTDDGGVDQSEVALFAQKGWDIVASFPPIRSRRR